MDKPSPIIVVGCPRSGTSVFAKLLVAANLITVEDRRMREKYPNGFFEHIPVLMFHKAMERFPRGTGNRADHAVAPDEFLKVEYLDDPFVRRMFEEAFEPLLSRRIDFLKYPQLALSPSFLVEMFPDAHIVALWRKPAANIQSLARKEFPWDVTPFRGARSTLLWGMYASHICFAKENFPSRYTVLSIDDLIEHNECVDSLLTRLGYVPTGACVGDVANPGLWNRSAGSAGNLYLKGVGKAIRLATARKNGPGARFADTAAWEASLRRLTDPLPLPVKEPVTA